MQSLRVLLTDHPWSDPAIERRVLSAADVELIVAPDAREATLAEAAAEADAILTCWARVTAPVIAAAPRLRIVSRMGIGLDNIDLAACTARGVLVTNVPDYCTVEVAEHTLALLFSLARNTAYFHLQSQQGRYDLKAAPPMRRIEGRTLGIVGYGAIGKCVAEKAEALGLKVLVTTRRGGDLPGRETCALEQLLARSDFVSLHAPLTPATENLIGRRELAQMQPTAFLINTARGGLVDHAALAEALAAGKIAGAALDVQVPEPPDLSQPPYCDPRVLVTPHAAFVSEESVAQLRSRAATQVADWLHGRVPAHVINREVLPS